MGARILVADDSITIQKVVELTFSKEDFVLVQARSGEETIRKAKETRPDLILLDLVMPDKTGYEVCTALRAEPALRGVPIILLAGTFESYDKEQGLRAGADDFVSKPFESQVLVSKVKQLLFARMVEKGGAAPGPAGRPPASRPAGGTAQEAAAPAAPVAPPLAVPSQAPPAAEGRASGASFDLPAPTEEISQDRLWQLLDASPALSPAGEAAGTELSLEALTETSAPTEAERVQPDIPLLELDAVGPGLREGQEPKAATRPPDATSLPESLSLDELLQAPPAPPPSDAAPLVEEEAGTPSVFDLSEHLEAPPLPMTEVAESDPAGMSIADLLGEGAAATAMEGSPAALPAGLDLSPLSEAIAEEAAPPTEPSPPESEPGEAPIGIPLTPAEVAAIEAGAAQTAGPPAEAGAAPGGESAAGEPLPAFSEGEVAGMREAVTERVAHELARDLTEKLVERIERIVWEVVPDLAEILIAKEIERIRAMAQDKQSA